MRAAVQVWRRKQGGELYLKQYLLDRKYGDKLYAKSAEEFKTFKDIELIPMSPYNGVAHELDLKGLQANATGVMGEWSLDGLEQPEAGVANLCDKFCNVLNKRDRQILEYRFDHKMTYSKIGEALNISKERIRQLLNMALERIREEIKDVA